MARAIPERPERTQADTPDKEVGVAISGGIHLRSEGRLDSSIRWIPSDEVAHILAVENGAAHLKQRVRAFLAPAHVSVALHSLVNHVVDGTLGAGA